MSAITIDNDLVHYEVLGRGRPVILLHGWLGSWRYWIPAMQQLSSKYRTYALDLWGFGDSGKDSTRYDFESQVQLLAQFMEKMGITKAALVGHGLGAAISVRYARRHPDRVPRLMTVCPPLFRMAPGVPLTANPPPAPALPSPHPEAATEPATDEAATQPITVETATQSVENINAIQAQIKAEAETMPFRSDEMKERIRAALERRVQETPKSPRDAATPPTDRPTTEVPVARMPPTLPEPLAEVPTMPKVDYVPDAQEVEVQQANPLKEHLGSLDPAALLAKHVDSGADQEKLRAEVGKADQAAVAQGIEAFAQVDTLRDLAVLSLPVLSVYGAKDTFLPAPDEGMITSLKVGRKTFHIIEIPDARHFPMLENMAGFNRLLLDFLEAPDVTQVAIKETWERRVR